MTRRLLVIATEFPPGPGGIGTHAYQLARWCAAAGWDVTVLAPQQYVSTAEAEAFDVRLDFAVLRLATEGTVVTRTASRLAAMRRAVTRLQPDVVVASGNWAVWLNAMATFDQPVTRVVVGHGMEFGRQTRVSSILNHVGYGQATAVVCVSDYTRQRLHRAGIRPRRVEVIPNGGDATLFAPGPRTAVDGTFTILSVGNVSERKGQDIVVRALPAIVEAGVDVRYVVVGLPTLAEDLRQLAGELGVEDRLEVRGRVDNDELVRAYRAADLFAMTSREVSSGDFEGYGIAVIEAALSGIPAIVTGGSGLEEAVVDGTTGIVIPPESPSAFAAAALRLHEDRAELERLGRAARERALSTARWHHRIDQYIRLFEELLEAQPVAVR